MKEFEIERKFLLRPCSPKRFLRSIGLEYRKYTIQQYYLPEHKEGYVRYRRRDKKFFRTIKSGEGMVREETEYPVPKEEFESHLEEHVGKIIEKERFVFVYEGMTYELDRFYGALKGLCYLEIEFDDEERAEEFILPEIFSHLFVVEVTEDKRFNNSSISKSECIPSPDSTLEILAKKLNHLLPVEEGSSEANKLICLEPFESSIAAIQMIFRSLSYRIESERKLLLEDSENPEVLHQFRISLRKAKSMIGAFKLFLPPGWLELHRRNLSLLMAQTNIRRDSDVLLAKIPYYRSLLPIRLQKELSLLEQLLLEKKESSGRHIHALAENELLNYEIASFMRPKMQSLVSEEIMGQPIVITAMKIVCREAGDIVKKGKRLNKHSGEKAYHKLRIRYKKMRYFIEEMQSLIEREKYKESVKLIKKMQTILGDLHDYQVQRTLLVSLGKETALQKKKTKQAMSLLIKKIEKLEEEQEEKFRKKFVKMEMYEKRFRRLFEVY
ncbi:MAG: CHAD domain-containing protein [Campylobacterota bacterium]|nr:CHAD domain-containing protein [Campylobacterota bacterium]